MEVTIRINKQLIDQVSMMVVETIGFKPTRAMLLEFFQSDIDNVYYHECNNKYKLEDSVQAFFSEQLLG